MEITKKKYKAALEVVKKYKEQKRNRIRHLYTTEDGVKLYNNTRIKLYTVWIRTDLKSMKAKHYERDTMMYRGSGLNEMDYAFFTTTEAAKEYIKKHKK